MLPNTGDVQSSVVSAPPTVCPGAIGTGARTLHSTNVAVKSSSPIVVKSRDGGVNVYVPRLGVTRYVVPGTKPVCDQNPMASVCTGAGSAPVPSTRENVTVTPGSGAPVAVRMPATGYGNEASAKLTS